VIGGIGGITDEAKLNPDSSCFAMGQSAGGVREVKPVAEIVGDIMRDAEAAIGRMASLRVKATT
jgi:enoyl-[acyl-carrier protein] reductase II